MKPIGDRVLVKPNEINKSKGGIILQVDDDTRPTSGIVEAVGPGVVDNSIEPGVGLIWGNYAGNDYEVDGIKYLVLQEKEILGVYMP